MSDFTNPRAIFEALRDLPEAAREQKMNDIQASDAVKIDVLRRLDEYDRSDAGRQRGCDALIDAAIYGDGGFTDGTAEVMAAVLGGKS
jgi:hypothetical protein